MNPNVNDFHNTNTQPLNHQFIDINHTNPFPFPNQNQNINFTANANYAPPASDMNQNFQPQPQQQAFGQPQYQVNQGFQTVQTGFPNATVQMNVGPQVTYLPQPSVQVVQQPGIQVIQPSYTVTTAPKVNNVVVVGGGLNTYPTITIPVTTNQQAVGRIIAIFVFIFMFGIMIRIFTAFSRF